MEAEEWMSRVEKVLRSRGIATPPVCPVCRSQQWAGPELIEMPMYNVCRAHGEPPETSLYLTISCDGCGGALFFELGMVDMLDSEADETASGKE